VYKYFSTKQIIKQIFFKKKMPVLASPGYVSPMLRYNLQKPIRLPFRKSIPILISTTKKFYQKESTEIFPNSPSGCKNILFCV